MSDDYHKDFASVSKTMLTLFLHSRLEYFHTYVTGQMQPKEPTRPMLAGQLLHTMLLEDKAFDDLVLPYPASCLNVSGGLIGPKAAAFRAEYPEFICMKEAECESIHNVVRAVMGHSQLSQVVATATERERRFDATIEGIPCKCKPDIVCDLGSYICCYDLKFSEQVDAANWRRNSKRFLLWAQDAHYSAVLSASYGKPVMFRFWLIEVQFPFRVQPKWYDPKSREEARDFHRRILRDLGECQRTGDWSDPWGPETVLEPWDIEQDAMVEVPQ